jgi:hypothetical protein
MTDGALLACVSVRHHRTVTLDEVMVHWGWDERQAYRHLARAAEFELVAVSDDSATWVWLDMDLPTFATLRGADRRYMKAVTDAQVSAARRRGEYAPVEPAAPVAEVLPLSVRFVSGGEVPAAA